MDKTSVEPGGTVFVTLSKISLCTTLDFKGFLVEALSTSDGASIGSFQQSVAYNVITCGSGTNAATHNSNAHKSSMVMTWTAPKVTSSVEVTFVFTVLQSIVVFWAKKSAQGLVTIVPIASTTSTTLVPSSTTTSSASWSTTAGTEAVNDTTQAKQQDLSYDGCSLNRGCFGSEADCLTRQDCQMMTSYEYLPDVDSFELILTGNGVGNADGYVALGLSGDPLMGDDLVFYCGTGIDVNESWNRGKSNLNGVTGLQIRDASVTLRDGVTICNFKIGSALSFKTPNGNQLNYDLCTHKFYILLAMGQLDGTSLTYHDLRGPILQNFFHCICQSFKL